MFVSALAAILFFGLTQSPPVDEPSAGPQALAPLHWIERPTSADFHRVYPRSAYRRGIEGRVVFRCTIDDNGQLTACEVLSETPAGEGFGEAALRLSRRFRLPTETTTGAATAGGVVQIPIQFRLR
jgi:protein TonB